MVRWNCRILVQKSPFVVFFSLFLFFLSFPFFLSSFLLLFTFDGGKPGGGMITLGIPPRSKSGGYISPPSPRDLRQWFNAYTDGIYVIIYMINSTVNPLVYGAANKEYQRAFQEFLIVSKKAFGFHQIIWYITDNNCRWHWSYHSFRLQNVPDTKYSNFVYKGQTLVGKIKPLVTIP